MEVRRARLICIVMGKFESTRALWSARELPNHFRENSRTKKMRLYSNIGYVDLHFNTKTHVDGRR